MSASCSARLRLKHLLADKTSIYRSQRDRFDDRQILPGFSVRRLRIPDGWAGRDLRALALRRDYGLTVIGMIDRPNDGDGSQERVVLSPSAEQPHTRGDVLIALGENDKLDRLELAMKSAAEPPAASIEDG